jgi:hypothetical protein
MDSTLSSGSVPKAIYLIDNVQLYELPDTNNSFSLYPNPNQGALQFDLTTEHELNLTVLDMQGKLVHEQTFPAQQHQYYADLRHLSKGVYYYHINYGNELNKGRFVLE